jgi:hypothetical protein
MSKKGKFQDKNQTALDFDTPIAEYESLRTQLIAGPEKTERIENWDEACIEVAASVKNALRSWGKSREELVDAINKYFGATPEGRHLSIHMFNHYLSKPVEYPMPAALIYAVQHITGSLETIANFAVAEGGRVITAGEVRELAIGKIDAAIDEMQKLKKEFRGIKK